MNNTKPNPKPCPFCGESVHIVPIIADIQDLSADSIPTWQIRCAHCGSSGPFKKETTEAQATEFWNRRAQPNVG